MGLRRIRLEGGGVVAVFATTQAAVAALIVRAVHRIGSHVVTDRWVWGIMTAAAAAHLAIAAVDESQSKLRPMSGSCVARTNARSLRDGELSNASTFTRTKRSIRS